MTDLRYPDLCPSCGRAVLLARHPLYGTLYFVPSGGWSQLAKSGCVTCGGKLPLEETPDA